MAVNTPSLLSNSVRIQYLADYMMGAKPARIYDQFATPIPGNMAELSKGSSVQVPFLGMLPPSTQTISTTTDIVPRVIKDAKATITPTSRGDAIQDAEVLFTQTYTDYIAKRVQRVGEQQMTSIDLLAQAACLTGTNVHRPAARASLDAGTTTHRLTDTVFSIVARRLMSIWAPDWVGGDMAGMNMPDQFALMHPDVYMDLLLTANILTYGTYTQASGAILLNYELGKLGAFRLVADPRAKVFGGAGADNGSAVATTLNGAVDELATSIVVASASNIAVGQQLTIGTEETANTHYPDNEIVYVDDSWTSGTTIPIIGGGPNGGLKYAHATGVAVRNADHAYPVVFGGPMSIAKLYATDYISDTGTEMSAGDMGVMVGPKPWGILNQWATVGWKFYGGYGRWAENVLLRGEFSSSVQA